MPIRTALTLLLLTLVLTAWLMLAVAKVVVVVEVVVVVVVTWAVAACRTQARGTATAEEQGMSHGMGLAPMAKVWMVGTCQTSLGRMAADMSQGAVTWQVMCPLWEWYQHSRQVSSGVRLVAGTSQMLLGCRLRGSSGARLKGRIKVKGKNKDRDRVRV
jgi:hypothetical protein